jgi:hypothetical protein
MDDVNRSVAYLDRKFATVLAELQRHREYDSHGFGYFL